MSKEIDRGLYPFCVVYDPDAKHFVAWHPDFGFPACSGIGETADEAIRNLDQTAATVVGYYQEKGRALPEPTLWSPGSFIPPELDTTWARVPAERPSVFWTANRDTEHLSHEEPDEAVLAFLDDLEADLWPETIDLHGFARLQPTLRAGSTLDSILEHLDEEYGDPDGGPQETTEAMRRAEAAFHRVVLHEYESWACEEVEQTQVNTADWVRKNRPGWIRDYAEIAAWIAARTRIDE